VSSILRAPADVGYLSNKRMALEIAIGLAHLTNRQLSLPVDEPIGWGPRPAREPESSGTPSSLRDLFELPIPVMSEDEFAAATAGRPRRRLDWPELAAAVLVDPPDAAQDPDVGAFANGRRVITLDPAWVADPVLELPRTLAYYSHFFCLRAGPRRALFDLLEAVQPRPPYREFARALAEELGPYNATHIRRTDLLVGVRDYRRVTPWMLRDTLAEVFAADVPLIVCTEADPASDVFVPLRAHFSEIVFLNDYVLGSASDRFDALPRHDDPALAMVSQEVAARAQGFVGTLSSTFTGIIQRRRRLGDQSAPFLFTADFLGGDSRFEAGEYQPVRDGPYTWNRLGLPLDPPTFSWIREWPEVAR